MIDFADSHNSVKSHRYIRIYLDQNIFSDEVLQPREKIVARSRALRLQQGVSHYVCT